MCGSVFLLEVSKLEQCNPFIYNFITFLLFIVLFVSTDRQHKRLPVGGASIRLTLSSVKRRVHSVSHPETHWIM